MSVENYSEIMRCLNGTATITIAPDELLDISRVLGYTLEEPEFKRLSTEERESVYKDATGVYRTIVERLVRHVNEKGDAVLIPLKTSGRD